MEQTGDAPLDYAGKPDTVPVICLCAAVSGVRGVLLGPCGCEAARTGAAGSPRDFGFPEKGVQPGSAAHLRCRTVDGWLRDLGTHYKAAGTVCRGDPVVRRRQRRSGVKSGEDTDLGISR